MLEIWKHRARAWTENKKADEAGAVTVDWVVVMAGVVVLGTVIVGATRDGTAKVANDIGTELSAVEVS